METQTTTEKQTVFKKVCPYCKTGIISMYEKQLDFNFKVHLDTCNERPEVEAAK